MAFSLSSFDPTRGLKRIGRSVEKGLRTGTRSLFGELEDVGEDVLPVALGFAFGGPLGAAAAAGVERMSEKQKDLGKRQARKAKRTLVEQKRKAAIKGAELSSEIALRSNVGRTGGRRSLLTGGETGFLLS